MEKQKREKGNPTEIVPKRARKPALSLCCCRTIFCILFFVLFAFVQSSAQTAPFRVKVMSFNVLMSGKATQYEVAPFAEFIRKYNPDVVALQEVDYKASRSGNKDFATELAAALGMFPAFGKTINLGSGEYGNAILSKYPFSSILVELLPEPTGTKERRGFILTEIQFPSGQSLRFAGIHLDHSTDAVRSEMAKSFTDFISKSSQPTIVGGDFNALPDDNTIVNEMKDWDRLCDNAPTFPDDPSKKIDYLFGYPKNGWKTIRYQVIRLSGLSDHCPILAEVELQKK